MLFLSSLLWFWNGSWVKWGKIFSVATATIVWQIWLKFKCGFFVCCLFFFSCVLIISRVWGRLCEWKAGAVRAWLAAWPDSPGHPQRVALPTVLGQEKWLLPQQTTFDPWSSSGPIRSTVVLQNISHCLSPCVRSLLKHYMRIIKWWIRVNVDK